MPRASFLVKKYLIPFKIQTPLRLLCIFVRDAASDVCMNDEWLHRRGRCEKVSFEIFRGLVRWIDTLFFFRPILSPPFLIL